jgi:hypothetical protein
MLFIPENELERALVKAVKNPAAASDFYRLLLESDLRVMGTAEGQEGATEAFTLAPGNNLKLVTGLKDGNPYLPVFSCVLRMQEYVKQECKYLSINGRALLDLIRGAQVILNPASEYGKELTAEQVGQLLGPSRLSGPQRSTASEAEYPMPLVEALTRVFAANAQVDAARMIQVTFADRAQEPHPLVGIEASPSVDFRKLVDAIQQETEHAAPGTVFDIHRIDRAASNNVTEALLQAEPFYVRGARQTLN